MNGEKIPEKLSAYKRVELENRLIDFALNIKYLLKYIPNDEFSRNLKNQLYRSSTSPAFNYGEAQSAETRRDFIHKMKISLKELRETMVGLKFIERGNYKPNVTQLKALLIETNELISIFVVSIQTAERNLRFKQPNK